MDVTGTTASYELTASANVSGVNVSSGVTLGTGRTAVTYLTDPDICYSLGMQIAVGETLTWNSATGAITGTDAGVAQVETATVVAAAGCTSNGNLPVTVTGALITGSPLTVQVALTTATHTTANLIATAIRSALNANAAVAAEYTAGGSGADVTLTKASTATANDATLNVAWTTTLGVTAVTTSVDTTAGVMASLAYRLTDSAGDPIAWDTKDHEGRALATATKLYAVLVKSATAAGPTITADDGSGTGFVAATPFVAPGIIHAAGNHPWVADTIDFTATTANVILTLDIHAGT